MDQICDLATQGNIVRVQSSSGLANALICSTVQFFKAEIY